MNIFQKNMEELMHWYLTGKVSVHIDKQFELQDAVLALNYIYNRQVKGKIVLTP